MDDSVRSLIRFVSRGFYSTPYILILDAVLRHSVLSEDDLIHLLGIKRKELRSLCNKLVDDRLLVNHIQREDNGQQKYVTRTYFFIHVTEAIDSIKWKVHSIVNLLKQEMSTFGNPQGYVCPRCGRKVSQLDAISLLSEDKTEFICDVCQGVLIEDDSSQQAILKQEKLEDLMLQIDPIIKFLKIIDENQITDNDFESALLQAIPAQSTTSAQYTLSNKVSNKSRSNAQQLQAAAAKSQATLHVSITANDENYEKEQEEKERRRQKLEQNALPSWHSNSTVGNKQNVDYVKDEDLDDMGNRNEEIPEIKEEKIKTEELDDDENNGTDMSSVLPTPEPSTGPNVQSLNENTGTSDLKDKESQDALAAYYAQLAEQDADEDEDEEEDDDDDEDDFDDIV
ncbi:uncharacterized protein KGF55_002578 [Candida pseudojiufengensis]|uniref:uncharacterized protein n=1 Tax=Candida pseudojiufengensis TaxID=497109 RepID=UPI002224EE7E|nr:uncharacterized protein KGF55_002578 [Candida pseudojiufengensis]KAI5963698.1 hypothetical protein KGF55_002578 [Candida pseudojiufengensis]